MKNLSKILLPALLLLCLGSVRADVVVVVGAKSPVGTLSKEQVSDIFLGKTSTYPDGSQTAPIDQADGSAMRDEFHGKVTGKSGAQLRGYWSKLVFSGKGTPPKEVPNSADVKKLVTLNPNMIGYVDKGSVDASVKAVFAP